MLVFALALPPARLTAERPSTVLTAIAPSIGQAGTAVELQLKGGEQLENAQQLLFSHPGIRATRVSREKWPLSDEPRYEDGRFTVEIATDVPPGRYDVCAVGRWGTSNPRSFLVTGGPVQLVAESQATKGQAATLPADVMQFDQFIPRQRRYFQFAVSAGEQVRIRIASALLDSRAIPLALLRDSSGREVAWARGPAHPPLRLDWTAKANDELTLELQDAVFGGGPEYSYGVVRILNADDAGWFPDISADSPGHSLMPATASGLARWFDPQLTPVAHAEANGDEAALEIHAPTVVCGALDHPQDHDEFECDLEAGSSWELDLLSRGMLQWTLPRLRIEQQEVAADGSSTWKRIHLSDSMPAGRHPFLPTSLDARASFTAPVTGRYRISIDELQGGYRPSQNAAYRMRFAPPEPGVDAVAYLPDLYRDPNQAPPRGCWLLRGEVQPIAVSIQRYGGFTGPVRVSLSNLPAGIQAEPLSIAADQQEGHLLLTVAPDAPASISSLEAYLSFETGAGQTRELRVPFVTAIWGPDPIRGAGTARLCDGVWLTVRDARVAPLQLTVGPLADAHAARGTQLAVPVQVTRSPQAAAACKLRPRDLPPGVKSNELDIAGDATAANLEIQIAADAPLVVRRLWWLGETKVKFQPDTSELTAAEAYRTLLQSILDDPSKAAQHTDAQAAVAVADQRLEAARARSAEADFDVQIAATPLQIEITEAPPTP
jgi:hypothetical protein